MGRSIVVAFAFVFLTAFASEVLADDVRGAVRSVNPSTNEVVIADENSGKNKTVLVTPAVVHSLNKGLLVKATLRGNSNVAESLYRWAE